MENPQLEYHSKEFIKQKHKGGSILQKMLNINDDENSEFSVDEYRNAIQNERAKRQQCIRANNDEHKLRREMRLLNAIIDPALVDKKNTLKQEMQSRMAASSKYINDECGQLRNRMIMEEENRKLHSEIQSRLAMSSKYIRDMQEKAIERTLAQQKSTLKQEMQSRLAMTSKYMSEMQEKLNERIMAAEENSKLNPDIESRLAMSSKYISDTQRRLKEQSIIDKKTTIKEEIQSTLAKSNKCISDTQEQLTERVTSEQMKQTILKQEMQSRITQSSNDIREMQDKLKERVMSERMRQSLATTIRKKNNKLFEMREIAKNNGPNANTNTNVDNWNVNNINIENDEDTNRIKRIIITKRRGRMAEEIVSATL
jgi:hypothetical protein